MFMGLKHSTAIWLMVMLSVATAWPALAAELDTVVVSAGGASISRSLTQEQVVAADGEHDDLYGWAVAVSADGSTVAVTSRRDDDAATNAGAVYFYVREGNQWIFQDKLTPEDAYQNSGFGGSIDISDDGDRVIVGDAGHGGSLGAAYIFDRDGEQWSQADILIPDVTYQIRLLGMSVAISGDGTIGVLGGHYIPAGSARAFVFRLEGAQWVEEQELIASENSGIDHYGYAVAISGDGTTIGVGEPQYDYVEPFGNEGAVYIFRHDGNSWVEQELLTPMDPGGTFGGDISFSHDGTTFIAVTEVSQDRPAWVYREIDGTWTFTEIYSAGGESFRPTVDLDGAGDTALLAYPTPNLVGSAYIYEFDGADWNQSAFLEAEDGDGYDSFAVAAIDTVALSRDGSVAVVGAPGFDEVPQVETGAVYTHTRLDGVFVTGQVVQGSLSRGMLALDAGIIPTWPAPMAEPELPADTDGDGDVDVTDLLTVIAAWGPCPPNEDCPADIDGDGDVDVSDLLALLASWT